MWVEDHILSPGFSNQLHAALISDGCVECANAGTNCRTLERFLEGVADTGRRGSREALSVLYQVAGDEHATSLELVETCFRLAFACDALSTSRLDNAKKQELIKTLDDSSLTMTAMADSLDKFANVNALIGAYQQLARKVPDWSELSRKTFLGLGRTTLFHAFQATHEFCSHASLSSSWTCSVFISDSGHE
jgi:hypothetical protein